MKKHLALLIIVCLSIQYAICQEVEEKLDTNRVLIQSWRINSYDMSDTVTQDIDTALVGFQNYNAIYRNSISNSYLGNVGLAYRSNIFSERAPKNNFVFGDVFSAYLFDYSNFQYYATNKPYTTIYYSGRSFTKEEQIEVIHTQNVNTQWNVGFRYQLQAAEGVYTNQKAKNNSAQIWSSYVSPRYRKHFGLYINKIKVQENGGISSESVENIDFAAVKLSNTESKLSKWGVFLTQTLRWGKMDTVTFDKNEKDLVLEPRISLTHNLLYERNSKTYTDNNPTKGFYSEFFVDSLISLDTASFNLLRNEVQIKCHENTLSFLKTGAKLLIGNELNNISNLKQYLILNNDTSFSNTYVSASLFNEISKKLQWNVSLKYYIAGYNKHNTDLNFNALKLFYGTKDTSFIQLSVSSSQLLPSYFEQHYFSNRIRWDKNFENVGESGVKMLFNKPLWKAKIGISAFWLKNSIYYDSTAHPVQDSGSIQVVSAWLQKDFRFRKLYWQNRFVFQTVSDTSFLKIPRFALYSSLFIEQKLFKNVLTLQFGTDLRFTSTYSLPDYFPATGMFYLQNESYSKNLPLLDLFVNAKLKKTVFFFRFENLQYRMWKINYFSTNDYPCGNYVFKFGMRWKFHD